MKYKYKAKCSQCGRGFRSETRSELLARLRKHLWKNHSDWMKRRIKVGLKRARNKAQNNPSSILARLSLPSVKGLLSPKWAGFAERPVIEAATGRPYEQVKQEVLDVVVGTLLAGLTKGKK